MPIVRSRRQTVRRHSRSGLPSPEDLGTGHARSKLASVRTAMGLTPKSTPE
jgi:hypothetical protein